MSDLEVQVPHSDPFADVEFVDNPEPRCPCLLLLDSSGSMRGRPIDELNEGIATFRRELLADDLAAKRVEIALVSFGPVRVVSDFESVDRFQPPALTAGGDTPMGQAIVHGLEMLRQRKEAYRANGVAYYRPWAFLITDGAPTDNYQAAADLVRAGEQARALSFYAIAVENGDLATLRKISIREPLKLKELQFRQFFSWLSSSLRAMSRSRPGEQVALESPVGPRGWAIAG
jgi:uncharacterized protein YegL